MKIHPQVKDKENAKKLARAVGLNKTKAKHTYSLHKTGAKNSSAHGYADVMDCGQGKVFIIADQDYVWIAVISQTTWFKTSPVVKCEADGDNFKIETWNSLYELRKV